MEQRRRERRSFTDQHKAEVVALCQTSGKSIREISRDLDLTESSVRRWVAQAEIDAVTAVVTEPPVPSADPPKVAASLTLMPV